MLVQVKGDATFQFEFDILILVIFYCVYVLQPATLATNVKAVFTCLLDQVSKFINIRVFNTFCILELSFLGCLLCVLQVSQYIADGLERARDSLTEAANLRERFVLGTSVSRRVAAAAASAVIARTFCMFMFDLSALYSNIKYAHN